jgi:alpha-galactosidase
MPKVAMIGAGSLIFCKTLLSDMLSTPALEGSEYCLMAPTNRRLPKMTDFARRMVKENNVNATITSTNDRREALDGADYVVIMVQIGGMEAFGYDYNIPMKYGVDQCIGDSLGPGGIFRGLRTIPVLVGIANDMLELCPNAIMLNYANPMAACCWGLGTVEGLNFVGLCHGVQTTMDLIASYTGCRKD